MKRFFIYIIGIGLLLTACDKESSDNGDLEGFWQMTEMDNKYAKHVSDMHESGLTWSFQGKLLELRDVTDHQKDIVMSFEHKGGELRVYNPYFVERDSDDIRVTDESYLRPYGISKTDIQFKVLELSSKEMIIDNDTYQLKFRKY
jgi:hypothetical protein